LNPWDIFISYAQILVDLPDAAVFCWCPYARRVIRVGSFGDKHLQFYAPVGLILIQDIGIYKKSFIVLLEIIEPPGFE
jgi:hypothetical protein